MNAPVDQTNFGERQGSRPDGFGYYAHLSIYDYVRPIAFGKRVLDVGCGTGYGSAYFKSKGAAEVTAIERDEALVHHLRSENRGIAFHQCDLDDGVLPFENTAFDLVFCSNVLEHVAYIDPVISEFARIVTPEGYVLVAVPPIIDADGLFVNASNIFHITNLPVSSWQTKLERYFGEVTQIQHGFSHPDFSPLAGLKKPEDYDLSSFALKPRRVEDRWDSMTAIFLCRLPRETPLEPSHETPVPPGWKDLRIAANARQQTLVHLSKVDSYWRNEVADIKNWLASAVESGERPDDIVAKIRARMACYYAEG